MRKKISVILIAVLVAVLGTSTCFILAPCTLPTLCSTTPHFTLHSSHYKKTSPSAANAASGEFFLIYFGLNALVSYFLNSLAI